MPDRCGTALPSVNYKDLYYELINVKDSIGNLIPDKEIITFSKFTPEEEQRYKTEIEVRRNDLRSQGTSFKKIYIGLDKF